MLALIAGKGGLPAKVAGAQAVPPLVCALEGNLPAGIEADIVFRLETLGSLLLELGKRGVSEICLCGAIERPVLDPAKLDDETRPLVPLFMEALAKGDDGALRLVMQIFEQTGFAIRAAHDLTPRTMLEAGVQTRRAPRDVHRADVHAAWPVLQEMARADLGQACVIRKGQVLAREDAAGTDAMLARLALPGADELPGNPLNWSAEKLDEAVEEAIGWLRAQAGDLHEAPGAGAILYKAPKPGQDRRADLPTIGPGTALRAAAAGLDGIVIESEGVMVIEPEQVIRILDALDMFLWVKP